MPGSIQTSEIRISGNLGYGMTYRLNRGCSSPNRVSNTDGSAVDQGNLHPCPATHCLYESVFLSVRVFSPIKWG